MQKTIVAVLLAALPVFVQASDIRINVDGVRIQSGNTTITFGSRNDRGYYWDGYDWRDQGYWQQHNGPRGEKHYTGRGNKGVPHQGGGHCPPGQAKKGNC